MKIIACLVYFLSSATAFAEASVARKFTPSPMATGNGHGFAVVSTQTGNVTRLYAHPYRFERPQADLKQNGVETLNLVSGLSWDGGEADISKISYVRESHVISVPVPEGRHLYFMPFGLERNVLIALNQIRLPKPVCMKIDWNLPVANQKDILVGSRRVRVLNFSGASETVVVVPLEKPVYDWGRDNCFKGDAWAVAVVEKGDKVSKAVDDILRWKDSQRSGTLVEREIARMEAWRVKPQVRISSRAEMKLWRQSETMLRMSQIREMNRKGRYNHGLILASLPDGMWFTPWVRDMAYAVVALIRMGHMEEARIAIESWFNARGVGRWKTYTRGHDYQISLVRYFGDGSEEADFSGQATPNIEFDDWGLALWTIGEYLKKSPDRRWLATKTHRGSIYRVTRDLIVKPLLGNLDDYAGGRIVAEDSSLWEEHQENKRHFAFTTIAAIRGLKSFEMIAQLVGDSGARALAYSNRRSLERGLSAAFIRDGRMWGTLEPSPKNDTDGAWLEAFNFGVVNSRTLAYNFVKQMSTLVTPSGGYRRVTGNTNYEKQEFLYINYNLARVLNHLGLRGEANSIIDRMTAHALEDRGIIPEMYVSVKNDEFVGEIGQPTGSIPMVGYGAGVYIMTLLER